MVSAGANGAASDATAGLSGRKRSSSLKQAASSLPTVEHSLEEFIAKANQTLVDVNTWTQAETQAREEDERRKEQDALRWKQAETQMRDSEMREQSLRRQLDGLQGQLAEAEARAAIALSASTSNAALAQSAANEATISELKSQIETMMHRMRDSDEQSQRLSKDLTTAQAELRRSRASTSVEVSGMIERSSSHESVAAAAERVRLAEAKAAKALAAARAAAAGLTVSSADLAAIESGLVVVDPPKSKGLPVVPIAAAFIGGIAIMFAVWKLALDKHEPAPTAAQQPPVAAQVQPAAQPPVAAVAQPPVAAVAQPPVAAVAAQPPVAAAAPATAIAPPAAPSGAVAATPSGAPVRPTITPIDEHAPSNGPTVTPIEEAPSGVVARDPGDVKAVATKPVTRRPVRVNKPATKAAGITDPFADQKAADKKPAPSTTGKPAGGLVDPF